MDYSPNSNVMIGSKLALAISQAIAPPFRRSLETVSNRKTVERTKIDRRCEALKNRSLKLLDGMKAEDARIALDAARTRKAADREAGRRIGRVVGRMLDQQILLHAKLEMLLNEMLLQIRADKSCNPLGMPCEETRSGGRVRAGTRGDFH